MSFMQWENLCLRPSFFLLSLTLVFASIVLFCRDWELLLKPYCAFLAEVVWRDSNESNDSVYLII